MKRYSNIDDTYETLSLDSFELISDWYHYVILSALELPGAKLEAKWISKQIGIQPLQAKLAIERLKRLGLVEQISAGNWRQSTAPIKIDNKNSSGATKKFHKQLLTRAAESIDRDPQQNGENMKTQILALLLTISTLTAWAGNEGPQAAPPPNR